MSQQHTDIGTDENRQEDSSGLERFTRNRYFNGKLMTARDMQAEQRYHAGRLEALAQHVLGEGVVCGLDTTVTADEDGGISVDLEPGVAINHAGRPVVVDGGDHVSFEPEDVSQSEGFSLFIELEPCDTEKVPKPGSQDACSENCEYNRVVEDYTLRLADGPPKNRKPVPDVEFPTASDLTAEDPRGPDSSEPHHALSKVAGSYAMGTDGYVGCSTGGDRSVFLAHYQWESGAWKRQSDTEPRHHVYTNDMLYAGLARHVADFDNPHEVHLAVEELEGGVETLIRNERHLDNGGSPPYPGDVTFSSPDETLAIEGSSTGEVGEVTLDLGDDEQATLGKVDPLQTTVDDHLAADNPHDVVTAIGGNGTAVPPAAGLVDLVGEGGIDIEAAPDANEVGVGLDQDTLEELVHEFLTELVGPFDAEDWEQVRDAIRDINGVPGDEEGGVTLESETETVSIDEDEADNSISIDIGPAVMDRLDELESRIDALEGDGVDLSGLDLTEYLPNYDQLVTKVDRIDTIETDLQDALNQVSTLDSQYETVTSDLSTLQGRYSNVKGQVTTLEDQYSTIQSNVSGLDQTVQTVQSEVNNVSADLASTASNLSALSTSLNDDHDLKVPKLDTTALNLNLQNYDLIVDDSFTTYYDWSG